MLESKFFSIPAKSLLLRVGGRAAGRVAGRAAGEIENKANSGQIQLNLPVGPELGKIKRKSTPYYPIEFITKVN